MIRRFLHWLRPPTLTGRTFVIVTRTHIGATAVLTVYQDGKAIAAVPLSQREIINLILNLAKEWKP